jgi:hypothetical protein
VTTVAGQDRGCGFEIVVGVDGVEEGAVADPVQDLWSHESTVEESCVGGHFLGLAWLGRGVGVVVTVGGTGTGENVCDFLSVSRLFAQDGWRTLCITK